MLACVKQCTKFRVKSNITAQDICVILTNKSLIYKYKALYQVQQQLASGINAVNSGQSIRWKES